MCKPCGLAYALLVACAMMLIIEEQKESCFLGDVRMNSDSDCYASISKAEIPTRVCNLPFTCMYVYIVEMSDENQLNTSNCFP